MFQVLCAEMPFVFDHFLLPTSWFIKRISIRLKLEIQNPKSKYRNSKIFAYLLSLSSPSTSHLLPSTCTLKSWCSHCNNECYSIVKEDCNGNMSFENAFWYALTHHVISGYPSKGLLPPPIARIGCCTSSSSSSESEPAAEVSSSSCNLQVKLAFT